jgi:hypothetical protein
MSGEHEIRDHRFAGYSNEELAGVVDQVREGPGSESMNRAVDALTSIATSLFETDRVLRTELAKIGVEWESKAGEDATVVMADSADYGGQATDSITTSAGAVNSQGGDFSRTRNGAPESSTLRGDKDYNLADKLLAHTTDHSKEVQRTQAARQQAIDSMDGYADASRQNLANHQSLPVPPALSLDAQPISRGPGGTSVQGFRPGGPGIGGGGGNVGGFPQGGSSGEGSLQTPTIGLPPGGGGHYNAPGEGTPGPPPGTPGKLVGTGPMPGAPGTPPIAAPPGFRPNFAGMDAAVAGMAGGAGGGAAVGSVADKERLARGAGRAGGGVAEGTRGGPARGAAAMGGLPHEEAAAKTAERVGAKSKPGSSMMQPAAGRAEGQEDDEHVRKYGIEAEDVFADDRMVIPSVLGEDDDE